MKILLVGAGQLGSRHLQSCLKLESPAVVYVVDGSEDSLIRAKTRATEVKQSVRHEVNYHQTLSEIEEKEFDYLIIATGAEPRFVILENVLSIFSVKFAILEKVLFQELGSYKKAKQLLARCGVVCFVNCPLRTYPFFRKIKEKYINHNLPTTFEYSGGEWIGLACNSIHYLDLMNYLTSENLIDIGTGTLDEGFISSKRPGNIEFTGTITAEFSGGSKLSIRSIRKSEQSSIISVTNGKYRIEIEELTGKYKIFEEEAIIEDYRYDLVFQSDLTHKMIEQIEQCGTCNLITFEGSAKIHKVYIKSLLEHYNNSLDDGTHILPVT